MTYDCKACYVQLTSPLPRQTVRIEQNFLKQLLMYQRLPLKAQANESNFKKVVLWWLSQISWSSKAFSEETSTAKELVLLILWFWHQYSQLAAKDTGFERFIICVTCANEYAKEKEKEKNITIFTKNHEEVHVLATMSDYLLQNILV